MPLRVVHADDHPLVRRGCRAILEREGFDVVGEAADGGEAVRLTQMHRPDVAVLDLRMPGVDGLDAARAILRGSPHTAVVFLTMHMEEHQVVGALQIGVRGYVAKTQAAEELSKAIREAVAGGVYVSSRARGPLVNAYLAGSAPGGSLGTKDRMLLQLIAEGKTTQHIATLLEVSVPTAETYRARLMARLDVHDIAGLVRYAVRFGLIQAAFAGSMVLEWITPGAW